MKHLKYTAKELVLLFTLWFMFILPVLYRVFYHGEGSVWYLLVCSVSAGLLTALVYSIRRSWIFVPLVLFLMFAEGAEAYTIVVYMDFLRTGNLLSLLTTNQSESKNFAANNTGNFLFCIPMIVAAVTAIVMHFLVHRKRKPTKIGRLGWGISGIAFAFASSVGLVSNPPYNVLIQAGTAGWQLIKNAYNDPIGAEMTFGATRAVKVAEREIYVFGVGESMRYDHTTFSGYSRNTTPLMAANDHLVMFSDYCSTATLTLYSVPQMISRATSEDFDCYMREKSIVDPFKSCGFKTFVISCKKLLANFPIYTRGCDAIYAVSSDADMAPLIDSLSRVYPKTFFIVQMKQCHSYYSNFDESCDFYHPNVVSDPGVVSDSLYMNAYDNTIHYTDKILTSICDTLNRPDVRSAMIFAADHGEVLAMHGHRRGNSITPIEGEYHVPMFFWYNDCWADSHSAQLQLIRSYKKRKVNADNLFYTALDMADIQLPKAYAAPDYSLLSPAFKEHRRLLLTPDGRTILETDRTTPGGATCVN